MFWVWFLKLKQQNTWVIYNEGSMFHACNFIVEINNKFLRTSILKNICERLLLKIYSVLLFWSLEDISDIAACRRSTK